MKDLFEDKAPSLYVRLLAEELFRQMLKDFPEITHIKVDLYRDEDCFGIAMEGEKEH